MGGLWILPAIPNPTEAGDVGGPTRIYREDMEVIPGSPPGPESPQTQEEFDI